MSWSGRFSDFIGSCNNFTNHNSNRQSKNSINYNVPHDSNYGNSSITKIEDANAGNSNVNIVGIVLSKEAPKSIFSKKNPGTERYLLNFVVRDSPAYFASVTCWGSELFVKDLTSIFSVGDIVHITNAQVQQKSPDGNDDRYRPWTPVPFHFSISENHSNVSLFSGPDEEIENYKSLLQVPTKANNDYYTLDDVIANGHNLHGEHINLLAVVKKIGQAKDITTKNGKQTKRCELKLMDETCPSFALVLWDEEIIHTALSWSPLETVVFIADVRVSYDDFRKTMTATADSKTIITVNPDTLEAHGLYQFAHSDAVSMEDDTPSTERSDPSLETITDVYNVAEIKNLQQELGSQVKPTQYGISYAFITQFDIDTDDFNHILRYRCQKCRQVVFEDKGFMCTNPECTHGAIYMFDPTPDASTCTTEYSISLSISDHTGTIMPCHLDPSVAEQIIGVKAEEFRNLGADKKTHVKWSYLLERWKIYFKMFRFSGETDRTSFRIMCISVPNSKTKK